MRLDDPQWLHRRYVEEGRSIRQIAAELDCSTRRVQLALIDARIAQQPRGNALAHPRLRDRDWLFIEYVYQGRAASDIARELGCWDDSVHRALTRHDISRRVRGGKRSGPRPQQLADEFWLRRRRLKEGATLRELAAEAGVTPSAVSRALARYGIGNSAR